MTSIAFSLWRAVFLSDTTGKSEDERADLRRFLISLISDNSIQYVTDKNSRNWSFRYYLDNATLRLRRLAIENPDLLKMDMAAKAATPDKDEWIEAQGALEQAIENLQRAVSAIS